MLVRIHTAAGEEAYALAPAGADELVSKGLAYNVAGGGLALRVVGERRRTPRPDPPAEADFWFPCLGGTRWGLTQAHLASLQEAYPHTQAREEALKMIAWLAANGTRLKTPQGMPRFVNAWLAREETRKAPVRVHRRADLEKNAEEERRRWADEQEAIQRARQSWEG